MDAHRLELGDLRTRHGRTDAEPGSIRENIQLGNFFDIHDQRRTPAVLLHLGNEIGPARQGSGLTTGLGQQSHGVL